MTETVFTLLREARIGAMSERVSHLFLLLRELRIRFTPALHTHKKSTGSVQRRCFSILHA
ncbi:hypothetical protein [Paraburkholderia sp. C35]|uniref:hypothetical protein n=1 Tax=Paraburkholderia sp. C35 TaxID=2126993 RepID=UPI0013A55699|nr:hypothetical protein [Paraburkholderia sp. C35]